MGTLAASRPAFLSAADRWLWLSGCVAFAIGVFWLWRRRSPKRQTSVASIECCIQHPAIRELIQDFPLLASKVLSAQDTECGSHPAHFCKKMSAVQLRHVLPPTPLPPHPGTRHANRVLNFYKLAVAAQATKDTTAHTSDLPPAPNFRFLDVGCGDGSKTLAVSAALQSHFAGAHKRAPEILTVGVDVPDPSIPPPAADEKQVMTRLVYAAGSALPPQVASRSQHLVTIIQVSPAFPATCSIPFTEQVPSRAGASSYPVRKAAANGARVVSSAGARWRARHQGA
jgi:hypothetical protein